MTTTSQLSKRIQDLEAKGSKDKKIIQFPEFRELMQLADIGLDEMYDFFDNHARQGIYPSIEERRALIPDIFANRGDMC